MTLKTIFQNFHINFLNSGFSVNNESNVRRLIGHVLCTTLEGRVSQNCNLGLGYFFMLIRKFVKIFFHYFLCFISLK